MINGVMNWEKFRNIIDQRTKLNTSLKCPSDIGDAVLNFTENIQSATWNSTIQHQNNNSNHLSISAHVRELITQKKRARARWQRTRFPSDKRNYNNLTSSLKCILQQLRNESYSNWILSLTTKDNFLWRATRNSLKQKPIPAPLRNTDSTWCKLDKVKAKLFSSHLSKVFKPQQHIGNGIFTKTIENSLISALSHYVAPRPLSPSMVKHFINSFPLKKITQDISHHS